MADRTLEHLRSLTPDVGRRAFWLIGVLRSHYRLPAIVSSSRRSLAGQAGLFARGRTAPGRIVTDTLTGFHPLGRAFDIDMLGVPPDNVPIWVWQVAGWLGEHAGLTWGGRWASRDFRHFER